VFQGEIALPYRNTKILKSFQENPRKIANSSAETLIADMTVESNDCVESHDCEETQDCVETHDCEEKP
jgi:hypothetical protein